MTNTESVICFKDLDGNFILVNQKWMSMFRVQLVDILGKQHHGDYTAEIAAAGSKTDRMVQEKREVLIFEELIPHDGRMYQFYVTKFPVFDSNNKLIGTGSIAIDMALQKQGVEQLTGLRDPITGALNAEAFGEMAAYEFVRRGRYHQQLSLLMIEIDDFQKIHKLHSKAVANKVLVEFVLLLEDLLRDTDILFRIEEAKFAVLTPETGESGGLKAAKRIRELVNDKDFVPVDIVTVSIGVAEVVSDIGLDGVVQGVERALTEARDKGKNRIVVGSA
ncbi:MAG: GGDEF domain-containing protein [Gammaproteobacteria bacterium]|jgi:diguanylate cyclase (GGDEF)-like protein|nr:GGDEF domain-containing protein [Gammaproteobacteria bacterium]